MKTRLLTAALLVAPTIAASQPYSESMADCASIYQNAAQWVPSDDLSETLIYGARQWHGAAVKQSAAEGRPITKAAMWDKVDAKTALWETKGATFLMSDEFNDWSNYCKSFAKHMNVAYKR